MATENRIHFNCRCTLDYNNLAIEPFNSELKIMQLKSKLKVVLKAEDYEQCQQIKDQLEEIKIAQIKAKSKENARLDKKTL